MDITKVWEDLVEPEGGSILYVVIDGVGGLPDDRKGGTELEVAVTPNLDSLAKSSSCGLLEIVGPGITPGSGPGHLSLFGYDPFACKLGRGVLAALGIDFDLEENDVAARINFATIDSDGLITDRRAGRIDTDTNRRLCKMLRETVELGSGVDLFVETVSEHRAVIVLRGDALGADLADTDPQKTGVPPLEPRALLKNSVRTREIVSDFIDQAKAALAGEARANMVLLRGFEAYHPFPSLSQRFELDAVCIAQYPMYRGISRLLGMDVPAPPQGIGASFEALGEVFGAEYDFYFLHIKKTDSFGEDGDFDNKVRVIEEVDELIPLAIDLGPDVLVVTADHSTPSAMRGHSFHPVPVMLKSRNARIDKVERFDEFSCAGGSLGFRPGLHLMGLALAHAGRLAKFGA